MNIWAKIWLLSVEFLIILVSGRSTIRRVGLLMAEMFHPSFCQNASTEFEMVATLLTAFNPCGEKDQPHKTPKNLFDSEIVSGLLSRMDSQLRIETLYQNAGELSGVDGMLRCFQEFDYVLFLPNGPKPQQALIERLVRLLPQYRQPLILRTEDAPTSLAEVFALLHEWEREMKIVDRLEDRRKHLVQFWGGLPKSSAKRSPLLSKIAAQYAKTPYSLKTVLGLQTDCVLASDELSMLRRIGRRLAENRVIESAGSARLMCLTYTTSQNHQSVREILRTWGSRCDGYMAFSNLTDWTINAIAVAPSEDWKEAYNHMWTKSQFIWRVVANTFVDDYDFFLIGGDDLFVIVENVRRLLSTPAVSAKPPQEPQYLGRLLHQNDLTSFASGGSGYVLNSAAIRLLVHLLDSDPNCFSEIVTGMEDLMVGNCLSQYGVHPANISGWETIEDHFSDSEYFHPVSPREALDASEMWYRRMAASYVAGPKCCSDSSISFHNIKAPNYSMSCLFDHIYNVEDNELAPTIPKTAN